MFLTVAAAVILYVARVGLRAVSNRAAAATTATMLPAKSASSRRQVRPFPIPYVSQSSGVEHDPNSVDLGAKAASTWIQKDCSHEIDYPRLKTEVRGFWTDSDLYLLFISPVHRTEPLVARRQ